MCFNLSAIKRVVLAAVAAVVLTLIINAGYGLVFLSWQGISLPEALGEMWAAVSYLVLGLFLTAVGAILDARLATGANSRWTSPVAGAGLALVVIVVSWFQGRLDFWLLPNALMAVVGGWLALQFNRQNK